MKPLKEYLLNEAISDSNMRPRNNKELKELVKKLIRERGNEADLNDIDTSKIDDMSELFADSDFNGDI